MDALSTGTYTVYAGQKINSKPEEKYGIYETCRQGRARDTENCGFDGRVTRSLRGRRTHKTVT